MASDPTVVEVVVERRAPGRSPLIAAGCATVTVRVEAPATYGADELAQLQHAAARAAGLTAMEVTGPGPHVDAPPAAVRKDSPAQALDRAAAERGEPNYGTHNSPAWDAPAPPEPEVPPRGRGWQKFVDERLADHDQRLDALARDTQLHQDVAHLQSEVGLAHRRLDAAGAPAGRQLESIEAALQQLRDEQEGPGDDIPF